MTVDELAAAVPRNDWLDTALTEIGSAPSAIHRLLPAAGRSCGRGPLESLPGWRTDDAARVLLLAALPQRGPTLAAELATLYRYGDGDEKRAVLLALPWLDVGSGCVDLLLDALRTNDTRLVAAALGPYARHLSDDVWRQGVLKCVFLEVPLAVVDGLNERADGELARMLAALAEERSAAGRTMPADAMALLDRHLSEEGP